MDLIPSLEETDFEDLWKTFFDTIGIKERENKELREKKRSTRLNRKNMKKRYFKSNTEYFKFCDRIDITIYIVDTTKADKIVVWYGAKLGRPKKNNSKPTPKEYRKRNNLKRLYHIF